MLNAIKCIFLLICVILISDVSLSRQTDGDIGMRCFSRRHNRPVTSCQKCSMGVHYHMACRQQPRVFFTQCVQISESIKCILKMARPVQCIPRVSYPQMPDVGAGFHSNQCRLIRVDESVLNDLCPEFSTAQYLHIILMV